MCSQLKKSLTVIIIVSLSACAAVGNEELELTSPSPQQSYSDYSSYGQFDSQSSSPHMAQQSDVESHSSSTPLTGLNNEDNSSSTPGQIPDPGTQAYSCSETIDCLNLCDSDNESCTENCLNRSQNDAINQLRSIYSCIELNHCQSNLCYFLACSLEINSCLDGLQNDTLSDSYMPVDLNFGSGSNTCEASMNCMMDCAQDDNDCMVACSQEASASAWDQEETLQVCIEEKDCQDWECVETQCGHSFRSCFGDQTTMNNGTDQRGSQPDGVQNNQLSCNEILSCTNACNNNQSCRQNCGANARVDSLLLFNQVVICYETNCIYHPNAELCLNQSCGQALNACQSDR